MTHISSIVELMIDLVKSMAVVIVLAYIMTRTKVYAAILSERRTTASQKFALAVVFGLFSIFGTLGGIDFMGAIANIRDLGPAIAGLIGGPWAGLGAGLIGAAHRWTLGGLTVVPCCVSTVVAGLAGGVIYQLRNGRFPGIGGSVTFMAAMEAFHMGLALVIVKPFGTILPIIASLSLPMILSNALGMGIFAFIIENLRRERETERAKERIASELSVASEIQMSIVPKIFPAFPERREFDIFAVIDPAHEVGGDLYDFFLLDDDHLCFAIGDVSGKGVPASLFMAVTKTLIKAKADIRLGPDEVLYRVNNELYKDNDSGMFATVFLGVLAISTGELVFSNGGHTNPYLRRKDGAVEALPRTQGMALGVMEGVRYASAAIRVHAGDSLVAYTDGVTEAMNPAGELMKQARLDDALRRFEGGTAEEAVRHVLNETRLFADGATQSDDIAILVLKVQSPPQLNYRLPNSLDEIPALAEAVEAFAAGNGVPQKAAFEVNLSLDELLTNTISYGFPSGGEHEIAVRLGFEGDAIAIEIRDDAAAFNPLDRSEPDIRQDIDDRPVGGLGIHLVRKMMDEIEYRREAGCNVLTMKKRLKGA